MAACGADVPLALTRWPLQAVIDSLALRLSSLPSRPRVLIRWRVFNLGGEGEATRVYWPARCCDVGGLCAGPNGQDLADWIPRPLVAIPGGSCCRRISTEAS